MKRFSFRLASVLKHRELVENEAKREFLAGQARVIDAETTLQDMQEALRNTEVDAESGLLEVIAQFRLGQRKRIDDQILLLERYREELGKLQEGFEVAYREAEALRKLKSKQYQEYLSEYEKMTQSDMDEMVSMRFQRTIGLGRSGSEPKVGGENIESREDE